MGYAQSTVEIYGDADDLSAYNALQGNPKAGGTLFTHVPFNIDAGLRQIKADRQIMSEYWTDRGFVPENALQIAVSPVYVQSNAIFVDNIFLSNEAQQGEGVWVSPPADAAAQPGGSDDYNYQTNADYLYQ